MLFFSAQIFANDSVPTNKLPNGKVSDLLGWEKDKEPSNICGGKYVEPKVISAVLNPPGIKGTETTITADNNIFYSINGDSVLEGNVTISQPGRQVKADKVILHRSLKTGKIASAELVGHIEVRENGRLLVGERSHIDFERNTLSVDNLIYRINTPSPTGDNIVFWGRAKEAVRDSSERMIIHDATASTCSPESCAWNLTGGTLKYNKNKAFAEMYNAALFFEGIPLFYSPYLYFPTNRDRKTGFLLPSLAYSVDLGAEISIPFYLNLAPNYDATITTNLMSKQGALIGATFNYLTEKSSGKIRASYIYDFGLDYLIDSDLKDFDTSDPNDPNYESVQDLKNENENRGYFSWQNTTKFDSHWSSELDINHVSDDYFLHDFSATAINDDQLMNKLDLTYSGENWDFLGEIQAYQTLHMLGANAQDQYSNLPQLALNGDYPNQPYGFDYLLKTQFVNFNIAEPNFNTDELVPTGSRVNFQPGVSYPITFASGYIKPTLQVPITLYDLQNMEQDDPSHLETITRAVPMFDIDSGLVFERNFNMFSSGYTQTLEPRLYYLYVPYVDQSEIPVFDSHLSTFDFNSLFRPNRFSSIDRIGDANQLSLGLSSRFLDADTGQEKLRLDLGQVYAFTQHNVTLDADDDSYLDPLVDSNISPLIGQATVGLNSNWNATGSLSVNTNNTSTFINNVAATLQYKPDKDHLINMNYSFIANGDSIQGETVDLNRFDLSFAWLLEKRWRLMADWNYNISAEDYQELLFGLEYNNCCWAIRLLGERVFNGYDSSGQSTFDYRGGIQFMLKGLGSLNGGDSTGVLPDRISGFQDNFVTGIF